MAKIRLNKLPDGFEIQNGKVVKQMSQGGMMTGDQSDYSLVTSPYNITGNQFNTEEDNSVRYSLSSVPRDMANIEAEGGETVLTDLNDDGQFGLYNITGPRHSRGGVPMFLPEQSFIYSDTAKMKMNRQELAEFGIESRKKMTPAKVSKKFQLNQYVSAMQDRDADPIKVKSAELMIDKNSKTLSKLAFGQEAKKNFSEGVPLASYPYLVGQGIDPIEFTQKIEDISRQQAANRALQMMSMQERQQMAALRDILDQARYGAELPKAQAGNMPNQSLDQNIIDQAAQYNLRYDPSTVPVTGYKNIQGMTNPGYYGGAKSNEEAWADMWREPFDKKYGAGAMDKLLKSIQSTPGNVRNPEVEKFQKWVNDDFIPQYADKINEQLKAAGKTELNATQKENFANEVLKPIVGFTESGPGTMIDGKFGTVTSSRIIPQFDVPTDSSEPETIEKLNKLEELQVPDINVPNTQPDLEYYTQDLMRGTGLALQDRDMFMPFRQEVETPQVDYVLEEPTRALADVNEKYNIATQAFGAFAGPQSLSARTSGAAGQAMNNTANVMARVHGRNINTVNTGLARQTQFDAQSNLLNAQRNDEEYDATMATLQMRQNERNADMMNYMNWQADALTNAVGAYNLSSLYDQFDINPTRGGTIEFVGGKSPQAMREANLAQQRAQRLENIRELQSVLGKQNITGDILNYYDQGFVPNSNTVNPLQGGMGNYMYTQGLSPEILQAMSLSQGNTMGSRNGREVKPYAVPFYIGTTKP